METPFPAEIFLRSDTILGVHFGNGEAGVSGRSCPAPVYPEPVRRKGVETWAAAASTAPFGCSASAPAVRSAHGPRSASRAGGPAQSLPCPAGTRGLGEPEGSLGFGLPRQVGKGRPPPRRPAAGSSLRPFPLTPRERLLAGGWTSRCALKQGKAQLSVGDSHQDKLFRLVRSAVASVLGGRPRYYPILQIRELRHRH